MGPAPVITAENPMGTDGFAFVAFAHPEPEKLGALFELMGFALVARHREKPITLYRQGDVAYVVSADPFAADFSAKHGPSACGMGFRVADARLAQARAVALGAEPVQDDALDFPAIEAIGGARIYFVDRRGKSWDGFEEIAAPDTAGLGLLDIDHLTHNVRRGRMDFWADWYEKIFNFRQIRFFDIEGKLTGLRSRAMTSPCGKIRIPINESADAHSQIEEFLTAYNGEGIQHIACGCADIYQTVEALRQRGLAFMPPPPEAYYDKIDARLPGHGEPVDRLKNLGILIDGDGSKRLLQIFSTTVIGPIFFEFIQRKGDEGFGEGNFRALFESLEADQIRRGVLKPGAE